MKIPFNYLPYQFNNTAPYFKKWKKLIKSTQFTLGPFIKIWSCIVKLIW